MHGNNIGASFRKSLEMLFGLDDHQVHIQGKLGRAPASLYDIGSECDIGHKAAIHHINVNLICAAYFTLMQRLLQVQQIG
jgi:hypothetical protein